MRKPSTPKMPSSNPIAPKNSKRGGLRLRRPGVGSFGPKGLKSPCRNFSEFWNHFNWISKFRYMNRNFEIALGNVFAKSEVSSWNDFVEASIQNSSKKTEIRNKEMRTPQLSLKQTDRIIYLAWQDRITFEEIKKETGLSEAEVIKVMRKSLKPSSFRLWRKRVSGRTTKHQKLNLEKRKYGPSEDREWINETSLVLDFGRDRDPDWLDLKL